MIAYVLQEHSIKKSDVHSQVIADKNTLEVYSHILTYVDILKMNLQTSSGACG